jgi:hypothetical protein
MIGFTGEIWFWKGPAPWYFITVPPEQSRELKEIVASVTYGWGMVPVVARIGDTEWYTALWPKDDLYVLPIKASIRKAEEVTEGDTIRASLQPVTSDYRRAG